MPYNNTKVDMVGSLRAEPTYHKLVDLLEELTANDSTFGQVFLYAIERTQHFLRKSRKNKDSTIGTEAFPLLEEKIQYFRENAIRVDSAVYRLITSLESRLAQRAISRS